MMVQMKRRFGFWAGLAATTLLAIMTVGCAPAAKPQGTPSATTADQVEGSSFDHPVVLADAKTEFDGVRGEHKWTQSHYPGWSWTLQSLVNKNGRVYDVIDISRGSERRQVIFDITNWFGRLE
jgi:hypothetical protein